ncbi:hypothetical protein H6F67_06615 [Microcoleus sp. FACHB-1515]|uniref:hypothetical protein n=1 Tax=Cyanophyceae TaxID=3028117 RepID=UPI0016872C94|nr:hypothetical protein [Microcoleus sp. FACHB-1515]MBD2089524.1 hypothetical protein [Microcoleus sp. FACHB-1515]
MLVLNDSQALIVENLLIRMLTQEPYSVQQLEEAIAWFQPERRTVSCPMESTLAKSISEELFRLIRLNQG